MSQAEFADLFAAIMGWTALGLAVFWICLVWWARR